MPELRRLVCTHSRCAAQNPSSQLTRVDFSLPCDKIKAMAAKLARLVYRMLRYGMKYVDQGAAFYEAQHRQLQIKQLKWKAAKLGFQIVQAPAA